MSLIPLVGLAILGIPFSLLNRPKLPRLVLPLALFGSFALISSVAAYLLPIYPYKGQTLIDREIRAIATFAIGFFIYMVATSILHSRHRLMLSLRAIYLGGFVVLVWSTVQAIIVLDPQQGVPFQIDQLHRLFVFRGIIHTRVSGFAFEPSWFGDQLVVLYIPLWLASVVSRHSIFSRSRLPIVESLFVVWGLFILVLTKSRISMISVLIQCSFVLLWLVWKGVGNLSGKYLKSSPASFRSRTVQAGGLLITLFAIVIGLSYFGRLLSNYDDRIRYLYILESQIYEIRDENPYEMSLAIADRLAFAERVVYWNAGFEVFERYPILGVGLGNTGFLLEENLPAYGYRLPEITSAIDAGNPNFLNPKNLWIRLLAETGLVGFTSFVVWLGLFGITALELHRRESSWLGALGITGFLTLLAIIVEGFSMDTFALPHMWVVLGLVTAGSGISYDSGSVV
jgi:hypothetical protein